MLGFIDCGLLAKEIMMLFPDENNIAPDINSAIKSLSLIILGSDSNPSQSSQKNFCKSLRNIVEQLFMLQHSGEEDYKVCEDILSKIEDLGQQAVDWRINFNSKNQFTTTEVEPVVQQEKKKKKLDQEKDDNEKSAGKSSDSQPPPVDKALKPVEMELKVLISIHTLCWGTTYTSARFRALYPDHQISKSGITMWVKRLPQVLEDSRHIAAHATRVFDEANPGDIPLRYIYEIRRKLLHKRNHLKYKISKMDIVPAVTEVLQYAGLDEKYGHWIEDDAFCERLFHASSKINFEKNHGTTKEFFESHPKWFLD